jgi:hypothetical protein
MRIRSALRLGKWYVAIPDCLQRRTEVAAENGSKRSVGKGAVFGRRAHADGVAVGTRGQVRALPTYKISISGLGKKESPRHVRCRGSFFRKRPSEASGRYSFDWRPARPHAR